MNHPLKFQSNDMIFWSVEIFDDEWSVEYDRFDDILAAFETERSVTRMMSQSFQTFVRAPLGLGSVVNDVVSPGLDQRYADVQAFLRSCVFSSRVVNNG